jgi:phage protein U
MIMPTKNVFTDDDLLELKKATRPLQLIASVEDQCGWFALFETEKVEALIGRLGAAENLINTFIAKELSEMEGPDAETHNKNVDDFFHALDAWHEAAGK